MANLAVKDLFRPSAYMAASPDAQNISSLIRAEIARQGLRRSDIARRTGLTPRIVTNVIAGNHRSPRPRALIEHALGVAFWTDAKTFAARRRARERYGVDPGALTLTRLRALAADHLPASRPYFVASSREELMRCLGVAVADNPPRPSASVSSDQQP